MTRARPCIILVGVALQIHAKPAAAQIVPVGPFTGQFSETWESFPVRPTDPPTYLPDPTAIMGGFATISNPQMVVFSNSAPVGLGSSGPARSSDGVNAMALANHAATATIVFSQPVARFGAFWGADTAPFDPAVGDPALVAVNFYDSLGSLIAANAFAYSRTQFGDGQLEWHGWLFSDPVARLTYTEDIPVIDGLQADPVPEPSVAALMTFAALLTCSARRRSGARRSGSR